MKQQRASMKEKRVSSRFRCYGEVTFSRMHRDDRRQGVVVNFCEDGMCILTHYPVNVGTGFYLRLTGKTDTDPGSPMKPRSMALAETRWCESIKENMAVRYCVGLKYLISDYSGFNNYVRPGKNLRQKEIPPGSHF